MARWRHSENPLYTFDHPSGLYDKLHCAVQATESKNCSNHLPAWVSLHSRGEWHSHSRYARGWLACWQSQWADDKALMTLSQHSLGVMALSLCRLVVKACRVLTDGLSSHRGSNGLLLPATKVQDHVLAAVMHSQSANKRALKTIGLLLIDEPWYTNWWS